MGGSLQRAVDPPALVVPGQVRLSLQRRAHLRHVAQQLHPVRPKGRNLGGDFAQKGALHAVQRGAPFKGRMRAQRCIEPADVELGAAKPQAARVEVRLSGPGIGKAAHLDQGNPDGRPSVGQLDRSVDGFVQCYFQFD